MPTKKRNPHLNRPGKDQPATADAPARPRGNRVRRYRMPADDRMDGRGGSLHDTPAGRALYRRWSRQATSV